VGYDDIVIVDREDDLGGTWHVNRYPGLTVLPVLEASGLRRLCTDPLLAATTRPLWLAAAMAGRCRLCGSASSVWTP
jgi:hypothetical protein